jgi:hydrogenase-4 membrane subunit HyfE
VNPLLIAFLALLLVPLFVASWRLNLYALAGQGLILATVSYQLDPHLDTTGAWLGLFDYALVRGLGAPAMLYAVLVSQKAPPRGDVLPPNLMSWTLAIVSVLLAFRFADMLVSGESPEHDYVAVASAALLLGLLVLATQTGPFSQMIGALRIENAIAVLELSAPRDHADLGLRIAQIAILVGTVGLFRWYLSVLPRATVAKPSAVDGTDA